MPSTRPEPRGRRAVATFTSRPSARRWRSNASMCCHCPSQAYDLVEVKLRWAASKHAPLPGRCPSSRAPPYRSSSPRARSRSAPRRDALHGLHARPVAARRSLTWSTDLEHYLDTLEPRPGALAGSKPLERWRRVGQYLTSYAHVWQPLIQRQRRQPETRVYDRVAPTRPVSTALRVSAWAIETALELACTDAAPVLHLLVAETRMHQQPPPLMLGARRAEPGRATAAQGRCRRPPSLAVRWTWAMRARSKLNPITSSNRTACSSTSRPLAPSVDGEPGRALPLTLRWLGPSSGSVSTAEPRVQPPAPN